MRRCLITCFLILASCSNGDTPPPANGHAERSTIKIDGVALDVRVFAKESDRSAALKSMAPPPSDKGSLFLFTTPKYHHLHVASCPLDLTIAFLDGSQTVVEVLRQPSGAWTLTSEIESAAFLVVRTESAASLKLARGARVTLPSVTPEPLPHVEIKGHRIFVEIASTDDERSRGLMHRPRMSRDHGMIFLYGSDGPRSFYMRNTLIPLSLAYIRDRRTIVDIFDMKPLDETSIYSTGPARFVLEANLGWFKENNIRTGDAVLFSESIEQMIAP